MVRLASLPTNTRPSSTRASLVAMLERWLLTPPPSQSQPDHTPEMSSAESHQDVEAPTRTPAECA